MKTLFQGFHAIEGTAYLAWAVSYPHKMFIKLTTVQLRQDQGELREVRRSPTIPDKK
jgi:hypothetical protein